MLFNSNDTKYNREFFLSALKQWLPKSSKSEQIYVIVQNPKQRQDISDFLDNNKIFCENLVITTFAGLVYNTVLQNREIISQNSPNINLTGLDTSQFILKDIIAKTGFKDYKSQINILHQLFRRYSLIVQNDLTEEEVAERSQIAGEQYIEETSKALKLYRQKTIASGAFDYLRQLDIFKYLLKNTDLFNDIKYLCVFECEEFSVIFYKFLEYISKKINDYLIFYDKDNATRIGYLCAPIKCEERLFDIFGNKKPQLIKKESQYSKQAQDVLEGKIIADTEKQEFLYRTQMFDFVKKEISHLLSTGIKPDEIGIITPNIDDVLRFSLKDDIFYFLSGSTKLIDDFAISNTVFFLELLEGKVNFEEKNYELRKFLTTFFDFNEFPQSKISDFCKNNQNFTEIAKNLQDFSILSQRIVFLYKKLAQNFTFSHENQKNIEFLIKQIKDFETVFPQHMENKDFQAQIIAQLKLSVVSENSADFEQIPENKIIVATEQKYIDDKFQKKHLFVLDATSEQWSKNDIGPMYNAWVMQKDYDKKTFEISDNIKFSSLKIKRILRKILLSVSEKIHIFSSIYDNYGQENLSGLSEFLNFSPANSHKKAPTFCPRPEQAKILQYSGGKMAIFAVPGAGKTTVILAVVKKLLENGIKSDNIFVLTYMDSAAKNFKERLKNLLPKSAQLPNISTIHGFALRIIKENFNFARLNLDENFEIADDTKRSILFSQAFFRHNCKEEYFSDFERGISVMKFTKNPVTTGISDITLKKFTDVYKTYCSLLTENNLIDYDDMLILAIKLLRENPDILHYYQDICKFIIEDEAQDSSILQQELLTLLSAKHGNFVRCGDANQAITESFTNADTEGFRDFINKNKSMQMTVSQRCAKPIADFANKINSKFKNSFFPIQITQLEKTAQTGSEKAIEYNIFDEEKDEIINIANTIKTLQDQDKTAQIAILARNNYQVEKYESVLTEKGIKTVIKEGLLGQQKVFTTIFAILNLINSPNDSKSFAQNYEILCNNGFYDLAEPFDETNQFWWDLKYFRSLNIPNYSNLVLKAGYFYFKTDTERANVEILSFMTKRIYNEKASFQALLNEFEKLSKKPLSAFFKFFEDNSKSEETASKVHIMTIHKSKGDEFDYVFIPEFSNENFPVLPENYKIKLEDMFTENIKSLDKNYTKKSRSQLQQLICDETLRLIYVAVTRAKKKLFISFSKKITKFKKTKTATELTSITELI